jgi:hypothetical protein
MCDAIADGGKRCAAHTGPMWRAVQAELDATSPTLRHKVRGGRSAEHDLTYLQILRDHASTPSGYKEIEAAIDGYHGDMQTQAWLKNGLKLGKVRAEADREAKKTIQAARIKEKRAETKSSSKLAASKNVTDEYNLASVYPEIAAEWHPDNEVRPEDVVPYINAQVKWQCLKNPKHTWEARVNNRTNRARDGKVTRCPLCSRRRQETLEKVQADLDKFIQAVEDDPAAWETLPPAVKHALLARAGMLQGGEDSFARATALSLVHGDITMAQVAATKKAEDLDGLVNENLSDEDGVDRELSDDELPDVFGTEVTPDDADPLTRANRIAAGAGAAALADGDEDLVQQIVHESVQSLWNEAYNNPDQIDAIVAAARGQNTTNPYRAMVADRFEAEMERVRTTPLPDGYQTTRTTPSGDEATVAPNLAQRRFALEAADRRRLGNWSGTGAGKTLAGVLATREIDAQETLVVVPQITREQWAREFREAFPGTDVRIGLPPEGEDLEATKGSQPRVWVTTYDMLSADSKAAKAQLAPLADRLDAAILDEVHMVKAGTDLASQRRQVLLATLDRAGEGNPDLMVVGMSATPVVNNLDEAKSLLRVITGEDPKGFGTAPTVRNAASAHRHMTMNGIRWKPDYKTGFTRDTAWVDATGHMGRIVAALNGEEAKRGRVHPASIERALLPVKMPEIVARVKAAQGPTIVYSEYVAGMVDPIVTELRSHGITAERLTGEETEAQKRDLIRRFTRGEIHTLVGSRPLATGTDGLQRVCRNLVVASMPWTAANDDQLIGRLVRTGQTEHVTASYVMARMETAGGSWSYCQSRMNRLRFKRSLADATMDGVMPDGSLGSESNVASTALAALRDLSASLGSAADGGTAAA